MRCINRLQQDLQFFLSEVYIGYYTTFQRPDISRNVSVPGYVTFYQINKFFVNVLFFHY